MTTTLQSNKVSKYQTYKSTFHRLVAEPDRMIAPTRPVQPFQEKYPGKKPHEKLSSGTIYLQLLSISIIYADGRTVISDG